MEPARRNSDLKFTKLATTRDPCGTIGFEQFMQNRNDPPPINAREIRREQMTLAALIEGAKRAQAGDEDGQRRGQEQEQAEKPADEQNAVNPPLTPAIDPCAWSTARYRPDDSGVPPHPRRPNEQEEDIKWEFENVTFILNIIDVLSGDTDYIDIRKRKPLYATLQVVEARTKEAKDREFIERTRFQAEYDKELKEAEAQNAETLENFQAMVRDLQKKQREGEQINEAELREKVQRLEMKQAVLTRRMAITKERLEREREREIKRIQRDVDLEIQRIQFKYKFLAVAIPWIPPFLVGLVVFVRRRLREREGIEKSRLR